MNKPKIQKDNILRRMAGSINVSVDKYLPDAFLFAVILTFVVFIMGILITTSSPFAMVKYWYGGFWKFLGFAMQMVLIVVTGHCLASTRLVHGWLKAIAKIPKTPAGATALTVIVSAVAGWINWGFGLIVGALIAKQCATEQRNCHFPILVAAAYSGAITGMFGLSITAPLLSNTPGHFLEKEIGLLPISTTILHPSVIIIVIIMVVLIALAFKFMVPVRKEEIIPLDASLIDDEYKYDSPVPEVKTIAYRLENSIIVTAIVAIGGLIILINHFVTKGFDLNLDIVNFLFLILGVILHKKPINYVRAVADAAKSTSGIILQFPFYAGIMGMMASSGLVAILANWIVGHASAASFPFLSFVSCALVNLFIPSAGGQWMVQGPILVKAGLALEVPKHVIVNAYTFGDLSTNLIQPFWALPLLAIARLDMKHIWGYTFIAFVIYFVVVSLGLTLMPW